MAMHFLEIREKDERWKVTSSQGWACFVPGAFTEGSHCPPVCASLTQFSSFVWNFPDCSIMSAVLLNPGHTLKSPGGALKISHTWT